MDVTAAQPAWLSAWRERPIKTSEALARFEELTGTEPEEMVGRWTGVSLGTGHPLDGLLEVLGWHGKAIESPQRVHPLLFRLSSGRVAPLEPAVMPTGVALRWPSLFRHPAARVAFAASAPLLVARAPGARLEVRSFRGQRGTALVYRRQPIADHLRRVDADRVMGLMEREGMAAPFFFLLTREAAGRSGN